MTQTFILGSSMVYGVGGPNGGWADLIKQYLHQTLTGGKSYFTNARRRQFSGIIKEICEDMEIDLVDIVADEKDWLNNYIYVDGLHPNEAGHQLIFESIKPALSKYL